MRNIIEQLKAEAPEFFSQDELSKRLTNAKARHPEFIRKSFGGIKSAMRWTAEMLKQKYKIYPDRCNAGSANCSIALLKPAQLLKQELADLREDTEVLYRAECDQKLAEWLDTRIEEVTAAQRKAEQEAAQEREDAFKEELLRAMKQ